MTQHDLEARIKELEDVRAITEVMNRYVHSLDYGDLEAVVDQFMDDAKFQVRMRAGEQRGPLIGRYDGKEKIRALYAAATATTRQSDFYPHPSHLLMSPLITVEGDRAKGFFYLLGTTATGMPGAQGRYENEFVKVGGKWKISSFTFRFNYMSGIQPTPPAVEGWPIPEPLTD